MAETKDARKRSKVTHEGYVVNVAPVAHKEEKTKTGRNYPFDVDYKHTSVVEKNTPTKDKPGDTRLYKAEAVSSQSSTAEALATGLARAKSEFTPADSLTRAEFKEFKKSKEELPKKTKKKKKKGFFKRRK